MSRVTASLDHVEEGIKLGIVGRHAVNNDVPSTRTQDACSLPDGGVGQSKSLGLGGLISASIAVHSVRDTGSKSTGTPTPTGAVTATGRAGQRQSAPQHAHRRSLPSRTAVLAG
ncbi:hypothetical protein [Candidatus Poriferisodalis sp.]|uniref:hypothetical protein n=1 Tax=Candidatus Poriferisodalis sp. TaxID=3101277 RepID=UPI003AF52E28